MLYSFCENNRIPFKKTGKWIVANSQSQFNKLDDIYRKSKILGIECFFLDSKKCAKLEPLIRCDLALASPETGIIDSHYLMQVLEVLLYNHRV
jgi:2-hydroxyglutarate dehydrogenase